MSESLPPEKGANDRAFGVACWTLGGLAFVLLLMVGVSFSLSVRTVVVEKVVEKPVPFRHGRSRSVRPESLRMGRLRRPCIWRMFRHPLLKSPVPWKKCSGKPICQIRLPILYRWLRPLREGGIPLAGHPFLLRIRTRSCPP